MRSPLSPDNLLLISEKLEDVPLLAAISSSGGYRRTVLNVCQPGYATAMDWKQYSRPDKWHREANLLPLMEGAALNEFANDIKQHGVQEPIVLFEGKVLDGRNRLRACIDKKGRIDPKRFCPIQAQRFFAA